MFYGLSVSTYRDIRCKNLGFRDSANVEPVKGWLVTKMQSLSQTSAPSSSASSSSSVTSTATSSATSSVPAPATISSLSAGAAASLPAAKGEIRTEFDSQVLASQQHRTTDTDALIEMRERSLFLGIRILYFGGKTMHLSEQTCKEALGNGCNISASWEDFFKGRTVTKSQAMWNKSKKCEHDTVSEQRPLTKTSVLCRGDRALRASVNILLNSRLWWLFTYLHFI